MSMGRHFRKAECVSFFSSNSSEKDLGRRVDRNTSPKIRQRKGGFTIPSVRGSEQRKQRLILVDRKQLTTALGEALWDNAERDQKDLTEIRLGGVLCKE
jgi:hypothetical protein